MRKSHLLKYCYVHVLGKRGGDWGKKRAQKRRSRKPESGAQAISLLMTSTQKLASEYMWHWPVFLMMKGNREHPHSRPHWFCVCQWVKAGKIWSQYIDSLRELKRNYVTSPLRMWRESNFSMFICLICGLGLSTDYWINSTVKLYFLHFH